MRVFAGPNGSGKSSIIESILNTKVKEGRKLDFGIYVNADDIASCLKRGKLDFLNYNIQTTLDEFLIAAKASGLINECFPFSRLKECIVLQENILFVDNKKASVKDDFPFERIAQLTADYLRKKLLEAGAKFSFETVFSHESKVDIIKQAKERGYKVYLYFVSTEDPEINVYRVKVVRLGKNGHDVPEDKIRSRYFRSMDLMYKAAQHCYRAYFFDNSYNGEKHSLFASFKIDKVMKKTWDVPDESYVPMWFIKYYSERIKKE